MVDKAGKVYLIEINKSPSNEYSTPVTSKILKDFQRDQAKLLLDYGVLSKNRNEKADIGAFRLIHKEVSSKVSLRDKIAQASKTAPKTASVILTPSPAAKQAINNHDDQSQISEI